MHEYIKKIYDLFVDINNWLNKNHLKGFIIIFSFGLFIRILSLWIFLTTGTQDWDDMNEKVWIALHTYLINGINPYGQVYNMDILDITNIEGFYQYPPLSLIIHLPVLLWPGPASYFAVDFMPAFFLIHFIIDFYMFYRLWKVKYYGSAIGLWLIGGPLMVLFDFITFISIPMLFILLAYLNLKNIKRSVLYITLGTAIYTYLAIPALFFLVYYFKKDKFVGLKNFILASIPAVLTIIPFLIWNPTTFLKDVFLSQGTRVSGNFIHPTYGQSFWWTHLFSIPPYLNTIYNLVVDPNVALSIPYLTTILLGLFFVILVIYLIKLYRNPTLTKFIDYSFWMLLAMTLISPSGFLGYIFLPTTLLIIKLNKQELIAAIDNSKVE
ncbi:MAG: hypothetical protein ACTSXT_15205 [Candidatus Helarchaeota archaeon]